MIVPPEITFRGVEKTEEIESFILEKINKLERFCDHISSCRIAVEKRHQHQQTGQPFRVRIDIRVPPKHEVVVSSDSGGGDIHDDLHTVLKEVFDVAGRKLKAVAEKQRGDTKKHPQQETRAFVSKLFPEEGYGFIKDLDGREIYFHKNSVLHDEFDRLDVGTGVHYAEEPGEEGPQASTVQIVDKPGVRIKGQK